jgi:RHS repeat-associated protein
MGKHFLWDPVEDNIVKEIDDSGTTIADYTTEPYLYGDLISQHRDGQSSFYHYDGQGSTTSLTDSAANVTDTYAYSAVGEVTALTGSTINPFRYIGRKGYYWNPQSNGFAVRRRVLDPCLGRWLTRDTVTVMPPYMYADNSPLLFLDPSGLITLRAITDETKTNNLGCGTFRWDTKWSIEKCESSGFIIQHMTITRKCGECKPKCDGFTCSESLTTTTDEYTEVWYAKYNEKTKRCQVYFEFCQAVPKVDATDSWCFNGCKPDNNKNSCGSASWKGSAFWVSEEKFDYTKYEFNGIPLAGCLLSVKGHDEKPLKYRQGAYVTRTLDASWKCCGESNCKSDVTRAFKVEEKEIKPVTTTNDKCATATGYQCHPHFDPTADCFCKGKKPDPGNVTINE